MKKGKGDKASKAINNNTKNGSKARDEFFLAVRSGNFQHFDALLTGNPALLTATDNVNHLVVEATIKLRFRMRQLSR